MSKADISTTPILARRAVLAGIASAAALPVAAAIPTTSLKAAPAIDPAFTVIAEKLAADVAHGEAIDTQGTADERFGHHSEESWEADEYCETACHLVNEADWKLANTPPTTLAGVAAVLRFANKIEDDGLEWPDTDAIGPEGWHYQLRATMAAAIEALIKAQAGKAV
jgi:hypothetical protein